MSPDTVPAKPGAKDEGQNRKTSDMRPPEQALRCPRCDSPNTKFCYYNNYSLTQPRHFCKTCRRYWTKGGALRNVPIGGGCRKNKKTTKSSSSSTFSGDSKDSNGYSGGLKLFQGLSPAMDFQLGGGLSLPRLHYNQFSSFGGDISSNTSSAIPTTPCFATDNYGNSSTLMGLNFPLSSVLKQGENPNGFVGGIQEIGSMNISHSHNSLASSIESLSSINQDLHWKLQQQRLAMLFGGENQKESTSSVQKPQPILFQNLEISKPEGCDQVVGSRKEGNDNHNNIATEWFFESSYAPHVNSNPTSNHTGSENTSNWNGGVQAWSDLNQYSALP